MQYLTELHAHTNGVSSCAHHTPEEVVDLYVANGYTTLVLTNHYTEKILTAAGNTSLVILLLSGGTPGFQALAQSHSLSPHQSTSEG